MSRGDLTEAEWRVLKGLLPVEREAGKRREVQGLASGSAGSMPNISKAHLQTVLIPMPPLDLQQEFAKHVTAIHELKVEQANSRIRLDELVNSMFHRAFCGEL